MNQEPVFSRAGQVLLDYLRGELVPAVLGAPDMIRLAYPGQEEEFRLGLFLHDMEEVRPNGPPGMTRLGEDSRRHPDLSLAMDFMAFVNRKTAFSKLEAVDELVMLEGVYRAVHGVSGLELDGRKLRLNFHPLSRAEKAALWQSVSTPLQPAAYFTLEPVPVPSGRIRRIPPVREVEVRTGRKGRR